MANLEAAWSVVRTAGVREDVLVEALRDNPDGPVRMGIERSRTEIEYDIVVGEDLGGDRGKARIVWMSRVYFGATDAHQAGGAAFVATAREQDAVALAILEILESRR